MDDQQYCAGCGRQRGPDEQFCPKCGRAFGSEAEPTPVVPVKKAPELLPKNSHYSWTNVFLAAGAVVVILAFAALPQIVGGVTSWLNGLGAIVEQATSHSTTFIVSNLSQRTYTLQSVGAGQTIEGYVIVTGGGNDINFAIQGPSGGYVVGKGRVTGRYDINHKAAQSGPYILIFDNGYSILTSKQVTLRVSVR